MNFVFNLACVIEMTYCGTTVSDILTEAEHTTKTQCQFRASSLKCDWKYTFKNTIPVLW